MAEGNKQSRILQSEAFKAEQINQAVGEAEAILAMARARAEAIGKVAKALEAKVKPVFIEELYVQHLSFLKTIL